MTKSKKDQITENVNEETGEVTTQETPKSEKTVKTETLRSGADFHNFKEEPMFEGIYSGDVVVAQQDSKDGDRKKGDVLGYVFETLEGVQTIVGATHAIDSVMTDEAANVEAGDHLIITYEGEKKSASGRKYNKFDIKRVIAE